MARQRRSIGTFGPGVPLERAYRVAPDEDLGGWFESDGEMTVYVIDGEIELTLENEGSWRLGAGDAISHPADTRHRWAVVGDGAARILARSRTRTQPLGPFRYRRLTAKPVTRFIDAADHNIMCVIL